MSTTVEKTAEIDLVDLCVHSVERVYAIMTNKIKKIGE